VPETLRSLIGARLDALDAADRSLLQDASVLGRTFGASALAAISGAAQSDLEPRLRALVRREILELEADPRSPERGQYGFVQSLIREVAYDTLAKRDRRARHLAAARHFESLGDEELAGVLASHYLSAYEASAEGAEADALAVQARLALRAAAERAAALGGHEQAVTYLEQALGVATEPADQADILERTATSAVAAARYEPAEAYARRAIEMWRKAGDARSADRASGLLGTVLIEGSKLGEATRVLEAALEGLPETGADEEVRAVLLAHLSRAHMRSASYPLAIEVADDALAVAERLNLPQIVAEAFINKGSSLDYMGRRREGAAIQEAALVIARAGGWINTELRAANNLSVDLAGDEPRRANEILREGMTLGRRIGNRTLTAWLAGSLGFYSYLAGDDWDGALALLDEVLAGPIGPADRLRELGAAVQIQVARGAPAGPLIDELDVLAQGILDPQLLAGTEVIRADVAFTTGDPSAAYRAAGRAIEILPHFSTWALPIAMRGAIWAGSEDDARACAQRLDEVPRSDATTMASRSLATAAVAALGGRFDEAVPGFRRAMTSFRDLRLDFELARAGLDMVHLLGPDEPEAASAAEEARAIFERLGAQPYLERLNGALAATPARGPVETVKAR
jgi:tetratricopeptide (TPR) repeat protein